MSKGVVNMNIENSVEHHLSKAVGMLNDVWLNSALEHVGEAMKCARYREQLWELRRIQKSLQERNYEEAERYINEIILVKPGHKLGYWLDVNIWRPLKKYQESKPKTGIEKVAHFSVGLICCLSFFLLIPLTFLLLYLPFIIYSSIFR